MSYEGLLNNIYQTSFGRKVGKEGLDYWTNRIDTDQDVTTANVVNFVRDAAVGSDALALAKNIPSYSNKTTSQPTGQYGGQLQSIYQKNFGRDIGKEGLDYWSGQIATDPAVTTANVADYIRGGASGADVAALSSRTTPAITPTTYKPLGEVKTATPEDVQKTGLGTAQSIAQASLAQDQSLAPDISQQLMNPATAQFYNRTPLPELQRVGGIGEAGYQAVQNALQAPILEQARIAQQQIGDIYGGRGLYGSAGTGLMSGAQAQQNQATQTALSKAVADRYNLELQDRAAMRGENLNAYKAKAAETLAGNQYLQDLMNFQIQQDQKQRDFRNAQLKMQSDYINAQNQYQRAINEQNFQRNLSLAGLGQQGAGSAAVLQAQKDALADAQDAALWSSISKGFGGLLSLPTGEGSSVGGDLFSSFSGLWG